MTATDDSSPEGIVRRRNLLRLDVQIDDERFTTRVARLRCKIIRHRDITRQHFGRTCAQRLRRGDEIVEVHGEFAIGDTILVRSEDGTRLAKATANYSSCLLNFIADNEQSEFSEKMQDSIGPVISEKDIALLEKS